MDMFFIGVDVGTGSVRAALVSHTGKVLLTSVRDITIHNPRTDHYEQSSREVWQAVVATVRYVVTAAGVRPDTVKGIGFDATCSLVLEDKEGNALSAGEEDEFDIIMWMDHRLIKWTIYSGL